ncbi:ATP-binding protein [Halorubrum sp. DTA46]|uniref:ATP-binding protein n=1 Tax=Halorubrum sp. DTA46 TaxID=3402162 RepID=UPI003AADA2F3
MNSASSEDPTALILADPSTLTGDLPESLSSRTVAPTDVADESLAAVDAVVVVDESDLDRLREESWSSPVVAFVEDTTEAVATDPSVDAIATSPTDLDATVRWLASREERDCVREPPSRSPSRIERLNAGTTRLASVRTVSEAHQAAIAVADEVFPSYHCLVGVRTGEWVEPVAASAAVPVGECNRVRVGEGAAGTVVETGESVVAPSATAESPYDRSLTVPVGDDTVLQLVSTDPDAFDESDRRLADLLASHVEETLDRIRTNEALRAERDHLLALFANIPDPAVAYDFVDEEPIVHRVNDAFEETFGYDAETVVGESVDDYIVPATADAEREAADLNERLRRGENVRREVTRETVDGPRHFILHVVPIRLDAENVSGYAIYTDVTERRERESTLRRQNERLDEFASIVSHDLRNPLSVAEGYVELARETGEMAHLAKAGEAIDRMDELVEDLLSLARQGRAVGETEPVSLGTLARDAWETVDTGDAELIVSGDVTLDANPARTRELLENVFRNSVDHGSTSGRTESGDSVEHGRSRDGDAVFRGDENSETDPITVRVGEVTFRGDDPGTGFYIEDDGTGFSEGAIDRVFENGFTTDEAGTGLGLAITEQIAEAHGWEVRALTADSGGARFEFRTD